MVLVQHSSILQLLIKQDLLFLHVFNLISLVVHVITYCHEYGHPEVQLNVDFGLQLNLCELLILTWGQLPFLEVLVHLDGDRQRNRKGF
jgi:hypothetical protein